ncbi:MAG: type II toxin-antitoxin system VapC family toxin [Candidatus Helarchaeota archaeon]
MIMLDTTACIDFLNGDPKIKKAIFKSDQMLYITTITVYEVCIGLERTKRKKSEKRYKFLFKRWLEFINALQVLSLDIKGSEKAAEIYDKLDSQGIKIDDNDILIVGIMLSNGIIQILTRNVEHFKKIKEIKVIGY